jgi:hypothetical protein
MKLMADAGDGAFEPVLGYLGWWDCPRSGVALVGGQPYYFDCEFSEELDEYPDTFRLWPISGDDLADELEIWEAFAAWRDQFDSGRRPGPFPGIGTLPSWSEHSAAASASHHRTHGRRSPNGALTATARSQARRPHPRTHGPLDLRRLMICQHSARQISAFQRVLW